MFVFIRLLKNNLSGVVRRQWLFTLHWQRRIEWWFEPLNITRHWLGESSLVESSTRQCCLGVVWVRLCVYRCWWRSLASAGRTGYLIHFHFICRCLSTWKYISARVPLFRLTVFTNLINFEINLLNSLPFFVWEVCCLCHHCHVRRCCLKYFLIGT